LPFAEPRATVSFQPPQQFDQFDPRDLRVLAMLHALSHDEREIIVLLIERWASMSTRARLTLVQKRRA
jgi:hypothetical protein